MSSEILLEDIAVAGRNIVYTALADVIAIIGYWAISYWTIFILEHFIFLTFRKLSWELDAWEHFPPPPSQKSTLLGC